MDTIEILLIILLDVSAFFMGLVLGLAVKRKRQEYKKRSKAVVKNNDLFSLLYYTPGEPTDKLSKPKHLKENDNGKQNRNHTR